MTLSQREEDNVPVLVLPPRTIEDLGLMAAAALEKGWEVERLPNWRAPERLRDQDVALYGEWLFCEVIADAVGLLLLEPPLDWLVGLPERYRVRQVTYSTLGEARRLAEPAFIKPADDKCFPAAVYASGAELPRDNTLLPDSIPVLLSEPVRWEVEYRCFVLNRQVVTMSPYIREGEEARDEMGNWTTTPEEMAEASDLCGRLLSDAAVGVPPAFVLDVGLISGKGWAVVEANPAFGAGICGCDPCLVLDVVKRSCVRPEQMAPVDGRWVRSRG
jgi:hypothetical protein